MSKFYMPIRQHEIVKKINAFIIVLAQTDAIHNKHVYAIGVK